MVRILLYVLKLLVRLCLFFWNLSYYCSNLFFAKLRTRLFLKETRDELLVHSILRATLADSVKSRPLKLFTGRGKHVL
jgi:hypothetical protein